MVNSKRRVLRHLGTNTKIRSRTHLFTFRLGRLRHDKKSRLEFEVGMSSINANFYSPLSMTIQIRSRRITIGRLIVTHINSTTSRFRLARQRTRIQCGNTVRSIRVMSIRIHYVRLFSLFPRIIYKGVRSQQTGSLFLRNVRFMGSSVFCAYLSIRSLQFSRVMC